jgi:hypothetical protein
MKDLKREKEGDISYENFFTAHMDLRLILPFIS